MSALSDALRDANVEGWSSREIARRSGEKIHHATVSNVMRGKHAANPSDEVLSAFAEVFKIPLTRLRELAGRPAGETEPYIPPPEADLLDARQRRAVDELIRSIAAASPAARNDGSAERDVLETAEASVLGLPVAEWRRQMAGDPRANFEFIAGRMGLPAERARELLLERLQEAAGRPTVQQLATAARKDGPPRLRAVKKQQDEAGEAPDPEGPEHGA